MQPILVSHQNLRSIQGQRPSGAVIVSPSNLQPRFNPYVSPIPTYNHNQTIIPIDSNPNAFPQLKELRQVKIIRNGEVERFRDGTPLLRVYKNLTCCRNRFLKACPNCNCCCWFYSLPCWLWLIILILYLALLGAIVALITQLPEFRSYIKYSHQVQILNDYKFIATVTPSCVSGLSCTTLSSYTVLYGQVYSAAVGLNSASYSLPICLSLLPFLINYQI